MHLGGGKLNLQLEIGGRPLEEIRSEQLMQEEEQLKRMEQRAAEIKNRCTARERAREREDKVDAGEHRRGSRVRRQYTPKEKLTILDVFDKINADPLVRRKVATFEADPRAQGTPYSTVRAHWASPVQRAAISKYAGKEYSARLLRLGESRKKGKYHIMEAKLIVKFRERRARGRRVSARCL